MPLDSDFRRNDEKGPKHKEVLLNESSGIYERAARALTERGKNALERLTNEVARADVYPQGKGEREGLDFMIKFYGVDKSFEVHCSGNLCDLYQVVNRGQTLAPIAWEGKDGRHDADALSEEILLEGLQKSMEANRAFG